MRKKFIAALLFPLKKALHKSKCHNVGAGLCIREASLTRSLTGQTHRSVPTTTHLFSMLICIFLTSCGFHLRGQANLSPPLQKLYIKTTNPYGQLTSNLSNYLKTSDVELTDSPQNATTVLQILSENETQQLLSVSGTQQTRQYSLVLTVVFQLTDPRGVILVPPQTLSETRTFTTLSDQILAGSNEESTLYQQMRRAIVFDIVNRLSSRDITVLLTEPRPHP